MRNEEEQRNWDNFVTEVREEEERMKRDGEESSEQNYIRIRL